MAVVLIVVSVAIAYLSAPSEENARTAEYFGIECNAALPPVEPRTKPGEWLEYSPLLTLIVVRPDGLVPDRLLPQLAAGRAGGPRPEHLQPDVHHRRPAAALASAPLHPRGCGSGPGHRRRADPVSVLRRHLRHDRRHRHLDWLADLFARVTTHSTYPLLVALYSAVLGIFVPSGGSKWIIEAPYVLQAANLHHVHLGWVVQIYNAAEALPNLVNPFWMLPLLGILKLKARDLVGYAVLQMLLHVPIVFFLCWFFAHYIPYMPPMH